MFKLPNLKGIATIITIFAKDHTPELLIGLGIAGGVTSTVLAVKATPKAIKKIESAIEDVNEQLLHDAVERGQSVYSPIDKLKPLDVVKVCWKEFLPTAITGVASIVCIVGGTNVAVRRNTALITACKIAETSIKDLQEYRAKAAEALGEEKNTEVEAAVDTANAERVVHNIDMSSVAISGKGPILYYDKMGGQWFRSDKESIREAINYINHSMNADMYVSLNDLYDQLDMPDTIAGRILGWNIDNGLMSAKYTSQLTACGIPIVVFTTSIEPRVNYDRI